MAKRIQVGGRIESKEVGGIVTGAAEILDDAKGKKQSVINGETDDELVRLDQSKQDNLTFDNAPTEGSDNPVKSGGVYAADKALSDAIEAILLLIPSAASALNKLVDTAMMNSSISTATATFRGTYNVVTDLELAVDATHEQIAAKLAQVVSEADNNDYTFVQVPVSAESTDIRRTERYKFNGTAWGYEYDLNTSGFTAAQWAAINSGITIALVGKLIGLPTSSELQALLGQKQDTLTFDNVPTSGSANPVKSGGVHTAINDEKTAREQLAQTVTGIDGRVGDVEEVIPTGAAANNKLVANNSMEAYVTSIIEAITASFTIATADGHINLTLTQTNGRVASLTLTSSDIASAQALTALTGRVSTAESNITSLGGRVSTNETDIANLQQLYNNLQQSKPEPVTALPSTGQQQGVIYRLAGTNSYSDYMWNGSTWVLMATYNNAIDPRPKKASLNLVTSGGVFDNMGALDVSELNATENPHTLAQYVDLSAALAAIPTDYQKGGMSIKFVQSSDNKYVQYRLMSDSFNTTPANWQGVDDEPTAGSDNLVKSGGVSRAINNMAEIVADDSDADLDVADKAGNVIARFTNGHFKTKNFDSGKTTKIEIGINAELDITDEAGNVITRFNGGHIRTKYFDSEKISQFETAVQVNDGFTETSASDAQMVLDSKYGFVFLCYSTAFGKYGEAHDSLMMSIFALGQPERFKTEIIGNNGETSSNIISLGNGSVRIIYSSSYYGGIYYYKDYIFNASTKEWSWSEPKKIKMIDFGGSEVDVTRATVNSYIEDSGYSVSGTTEELHIVGQIKNENGTLYGTLTGFNEKPVLWYSNDNLVTLCPFAVINQNGQYEADVEIFNSNICVVNRLYNGISYTHASINQQTHQVGNWSEFVTLPMSKGSRPQISLFDNKLMIIYTIAGNFNTDFPAIDDDRTGVCFMFSDDVDLSAVEMYKYRSKYGIVYPRAISNYDDMYISWSDSRIGLLEKNTSSNTCQGKETMRFTKIIFNN